MFNGSFIGIPSKCPTSCKPSNRIYLRTVVKVYKLLKNQFSEISVHMKRNRALKKNT